MTHQLSLYQIKFNEQKYLFPFISEISWDRTEENLDMLIRKVEEIPAVKGTFKLSYKKGTQEEMEYEYNSILDGADEKSISMLNVQLREILPLTTKDILKGTYEKVDIKNLKFPLRRVKTINDEEEFDYPSFIVVFEFEDEKLNDFFE